MLITITAHEALRRFGFVLALVLFMAFLFVSERLLLPEELLANRMAMGVWSRNLGQLGAIVTMAGLWHIAYVERLFGCILLVVGPAFIWFAYFGAMEVARSQSDEAFAWIVNEELGCFPDRWLFVVEKNNFRLGDGVTLCSEPRR